MYLLQVGQSAGLHILIFGGIVVEGVWAVVVCLVEEDY